jgi:hypothetical protein
VGWRELVTITTGWQMAREQGSFICIMSVPMDERVL